MTICAEDIEKMVADGIPDADVTAIDAGGKFQLRVVSDYFSGLNAVKRQQAVYKILNPHIQSGEIHAVSMQLLTGGEYRERGGS